MVQGWDGEVQGRSLNPGPGLEPQRIGKTQPGAFSKIQISGSPPTPPSGNIQRVFQNLCVVKSLRGHSSWPWEPQCPWGPQGLLEGHGSGPQAHAGCLHSKQPCSRPPPAPQACSDWWRTPPAAPGEGGSSSWDGREHSPDTGNVGSNVQMSVRNEWGA